MKNVTITLDEKAAAWARQRAAERSISLSHFVGELLEKTVRESREYERAMREYLSRKPSPLKRSRARYSSRDKLRPRPSSLIRQRH